MAYRCVSSHFNVVSPRVLRYFIVMAEQTKTDGKTAVYEDFSEPELFRVVLLNDDFTTKDFVVAVLIAIFHKKQEEAVVIMEDVHRKGRGVVGTYTHDIAATRCLQVHEAARSSGFPLRCVMEPV
ncbi:MAG: ATP-dependent Clp protease adapter protein ClpS [Spirochaetes bacterium ADurb.Bin215]|jgi:ATP-dependent Clp protease adaptor protein ClpS|nr:MAG: ATP-dependent Clp protease adapter protein ClpS [Spirochaetes bacterium ADurb.Bin215]